MTIKGKPGLGMKSNICFWQKERRENSVNLRWPFVDVEISRCGDRDYGQDGEITYGNFCKTIALRTYAVAQLVETLSYNPESRGFDSLWGHWDLLFRPHYSPMIGLASNRNEY